MFRKSKSPLSPLFQRAKHTIDYNKASLVLQARQSTTAINNKLLQPSVVSKKRSFRNSTFVLALSPYLTTIMSEDGEPNATVSRLLIDSEFYEDHVNDISSMSREEKDQLFYGIAAGYSSKFGELNEDLTKNIIRLIIDGESEIGLKIVYGLCCAAFHKEEKLVRIILEVLQVAGVDLHSLIEECRNSTHPSMPKAVNYLESILNLSKREKERNSCVLRKLKNGTEVEEAIILPIMQKLERFKNTNPMVFIIFVKKCQNPNYKLPRNIEGVIKRFGLMESGLIDDNVKNIVLSAVKGIDLDSMSVDDPVEKNTFTHKM